MRAQTFVASESGSTYRVVGREVHIKFRGIRHGSGGVWDESSPPLILTFDSPRHAMHYASHHGRLMRRQRRRERMWQ